MFNIKRVKWFFIALFAFPTFSFAVQIKTIEKDQTIDANIAQSELNRIVIQGEQITGVFASDADCISETDKLAGSAYLKPLRNQSFAAYFTTDKGNTYGLILTPSEAHSQTIILKQKQLPAPPKQNEEVVINLIKAMAKNEKPVGYSIQPIENQVIQLKDRKLEITPVANYSSEEWTGEISQVKNIASRSTTLRAEEFAIPPAQGIAISNKNLAPNEVAFVYRVFRHENT